MIRFYYYEFYPAPHVPPSILTCYLYPLRLLNRKPPQLLRCTHPFPSHLVLLIASFLIFLWDGMIE